MLPAAVGQAKVIQRPPARQGRPRPDIDDAGGKTEITEVRSVHRLHRLDLDAPAGIPRAILPASRVRKLPIDPRVAFVLSRVDGQSTVETLVDVTGFRV